MTTAGTGASAREVVARYLDAFYSGDFGGAREWLDPDFKFAGPFVEVTGADAFLQSAEGLRRIVRGHRMLRQWQDGDEICSIFEVALETPVGSGSIAMCEWNRVGDGRVAEARVLFDTAPFRALLPAPVHA